MERITVDHPKANIVTHTLFPSPHISNSVIEPYNATLSLHSLKEHSNACILYDNEQLYKIMERLEIE